MAGIKPGKRLPGLGDSLRGARGTTSPMKPVADETAPSLEGLEITEPDRNRVDGRIPTALKGVDEVQSHFARNRPSELIHNAAMRIADILVGIAVLTLALPILAVLALVIRIDSAGPALFTQRRVGQHEKTFTLVKFRTMAVGTRQAGTHEVSRTSVTRIGAKLRHFKLDELPQAWNLLWGNMTLVGPRPCLLAQTALIEERRRRNVYALKPGLTGLAQVNGVDMSDPVRLAEIDAAYAASRAIQVDIALLSKTFLGKGSGDRVARSD